MPDHTATPPDYPRSRDRPHGPGRVRVPRSGAGARADPWRADAPARLWPKIPILPGAVMVCRSGRRSANPRSLARRQRSTMTSRPPQQEHAGRRSRDRQRAAALQQPR